MIPSFFQLQFIVLTAVFHGILIDMDVLKQKKKSASGAY